MGKIVTGRHTHQYDGELVVFHIGMQINRWWRPDLWVPAFAAMPRMLRELSVDPDSGFLGYELLMGGGGPYVVQYWSSIDKLYAYAAEPTAEHRPAWTRFNKAVRKSPGAVGIWHETFLVERAESIYVSTKPMGLPKATRLVPIERNHDRARERYADGRTAAPLSEPSVRERHPSPVAAGSSAASTDLHGGGR